MVCSRLPKDARLKSNLPHHEPACNWCNPVQQVSTVSPTQLIQIETMDIQTSSTGESEPTTDLHVTETESSGESTALSDSSNADSHPESTTIDPESWQASFADQFTEGLIETTDRSYRSDTISVTISRHQADDAVYFLADIYLTALDQFRTALAADTFGKGFSEPVLDMSARHNAIVSITGDYYGIRDFGIVVRDGILYRDVLFQDSLILYPDGRMETIPASLFNVDQIKESGAWQIWSFGPMLLDQGHAMETFNSQVNPDNPRSAIGYYEPGHYCFVVVDGCQPGYSNGMTLNELSELFETLGCQIAYNLDGGQSAIMTFMGKIVNSPYNGGRNVSDIVYVGENKMSG
jgi:exopolysaccharide biosynthesis protein